MSTIPLLRTFSRTSTEPCSCGIPNEDHYRLISTHKCYFCHKPSKSTIVPPHLNVFVCYHCSIVKCTCCRILRMRRIEIPFDPTTDYCFKCKAKLHEAIMHEVIPSTSRLCDIVDIIVDYLVDVSVQSVGN